MPAIECCFNEGQFAAGAEDIWELLNGDTMIHSLIPTLFRIVNTECMHSEKSIGQQRKQINSYALDPNVESIALRHF